MVVVILGLGAAAAWRGATGASEAAVRTGGSRRPPASSRCVGWNLATQPPAVHPDGGFPAAAAAADRIVATTGDAPLTLRSLPDFKSSEAYAYPLVRIGRTVGSGVRRDGSPSLVVICDVRFEVAIGAACGGPAEDTLLRTEGGGRTLADRFEAAPGRIISVYLAHGLGIANASAPDAGVRLPFRPGRRRAVRVVPRADVSSGRALGLWLGRRGGPSLRRRRRRRWRTSGGRGRPVA